MVLNSTPELSMDRIMDIPQDMVSDLSTEHPLQKFYANQITLDYFGTVINNIPQGMGIGNSHGGELFQEELHKVWVLAINMVNKLC